MCSAALFVLKMAAVTSWAWLLANDYEAHLDAPWLIALSKVAILLDAFLTTARLLKGINEELYRYFTFYEQFLISIAPACVVLFTIMLFLG